MANVLMGFEVGVVVEAEEDGSTGTREMLQVGDQVFRSVALALFAPVPNSG